jgi:hypothetical protein
MPNPPADEPTRDALRSAWRELCATLLDADSSFLDPERGTFGARELAEGYRSLTHVLRYAFEIYLEADLDRPAFVPLARPDAKILGDNADTEYCIAVIDGRRDHLIRGRRGDECYLSFNVHGGPDPAVHLTQRTVSDANHTEFGHGGSPAGPGDAFEIVLSHHHPAMSEAPVSWMHLTDDACVVISREYFFDKVNDRRPTYTIEPVEGPHGPPRVFTPDEMIARLGAVTRFLATTISTQPQRLVEANVVQPPFRFTTDMPSWGTPDNVYCRCRFDLGPDEALVVEGNVGDSLYWGIQLWNPFMQSLDGRHGPVALNSRNAVLDADGSFRVVVSATDPGVPNWLSTTGLGQGDVFCRWLVPASEPSAPTARVVPVAEVAAAGQG